MRPYIVQFSLPELAHLPEHLRRSHPQGRFRTVEDAIAWAGRAGEINGCDHFRVVRLGRVNQEVFSR